MLKLRGYKLVIPHRCKSTTPHSCATARPYGSEPYSRNWPKNKHFLFQSQFDFLHARVRVAPPPNNSASLQRPNQLAALLNYCVAACPRPDNSALLRRHPIHLNVATPPLLARARVGTN